MMKSLLASLAVGLPLFAAAESGPYWLPLSLSGSSGLHLLSLPGEVYRLAAFADLRDLRVHDANGEAMPFAFRPVAAPVAQLIDLPLYALPAEREGSGDSQLSLRSSSDGSIHLELARNAPAGSAAVSQYLLDRGAEPRLPLNALQLDWQGSDANLLLTLQLEQSDDLQSWQPLAGPVTLAQLTNGQQQLRQGRVAINPPQARYLRLALQTPLPPGLRLTRAQGEYPSQASPALTALTPVAARRIKDGGFEFDLGGAYPLRSLQFSYAGPRLLLPATLLSRPHGNVPWQRHSSQVIYKLNVPMPSVNVDSSDRFWKLLPDPRVAAPVASALRLQAWYQPASIVFLAQGQAPYHLVFGESFAERGDLAYATLMPPVAAATLSTASSAGPVQAQASSLLPALGPESWRKLGLWLILLVGVGLMGAMAWRLLSQPK